MVEPQKIRIDKWLWAVRLFKTRTQATDACSTGKVKVDNNTIKPSFLLKTGQVIHFSHHGIKKVVKTLKLVEKRIGADLAVSCYEDWSPPALKQIQGSAFHAAFERRDKGSGRPTKRQRRDIERFKGMTD